MKKTFGRSVFQVAMLAVLFLFPYLLWNAYLTDWDIFIPVWPMLIFSGLAIIVSELTRKVAPGTEDYVMVPLLLLVYFPFDIYSLYFKLPAFLILATAAFLLLRKK